MQGTSCSKLTWQLKSFVRDRWGFTVIMRLINRHNYFVGKLIKEMMVRWKLKQLFSKSMNMSLRSSKLTNLLLSPLFQKQNTIACTKIEREHVSRMNLSNPKWFLNIMSLFIMSLVKSVAVPGCSVWQIELHLAMLCDAETADESNTPMGNTPEPSEHVDIFHMSAFQFQIHRDEECAMPLVSTELLIN